MRGKREGEGAFRFQVGFRTPEHCYRSLNSCGELLIVQILMCIIEADTNFSH